MNSMDLRVTVQKGDLQLSNATSGQQNDADEHIIKQHRDRARDRSTAQCTWIGFLPWSLATCLVARLDCGERWAAKAGAGFEDVAVWSISCVFSLRESAVEGKE